MSEPKFTPGEWVVAIGGRPYLPTPISTPIWVIVDGSSRPSPDDPSTTRCRAVALCGDREDGDKSLPMICEHAREVLRAALAKARGES